LSQGIIVADPFTVFDYEGRPLEESLTLNVSDGSQWLERSKNSEGKQIVELAGWYVCLANWSHFVYFHWFAQCLASLELIEKVSLPTTFKLIVPRLNSWQRASLFELGFQEHQILQAEGDQVYQCEHLIYPSDLQNQPAVISRRMVSICQKLRDRVVPEPPISGSKLYLSRLDAGSRVLQDEGVLIDELRRRGYQTLITSMMDLRQEISAFAGAKIIVGAVGSGMTNIAFAHPGTTVIELNCLGPNYHLYKWLGERCGLKVTSITMDTPQTAADVVSPWKLGSDLDRVLSEVDAAERSMGI
jgi:capsular polysaccharide biosynthesis protein